MKTNQTFLTWMTTAFMFVIFSLFGATLRAENYKYTKTTLSAVEDGKTYLIVAESKTSKKYYIYGMSTADNLSTDQNKYIMLGTLISGETNSAAIPNGYTTLPTGVHEFKFTQVSGGWNIEDVSAATKTYLSWGGSASGKGPNSGKNATSSTTPFVWTISDNKLYPSGYTTNDLRGEASSTTSFKFYCNSSNTALTLYVKNEDQQQGDPDAPLVSTTGGDVKAYSILSTGTLAETLTYTTANLVSGENVTPSVKAGTPSAGISIGTVDPETITSTTESFSILFGTSSALTAGTYHDTLIFTHNGAVIGKTAINLTVTDPVVGNKYTKVTSTTELEDGKAYLIVGETAKAAMGPSSSGVPSSVSVDITDGILTAGNDVQEIVFEKLSDGWAFKEGTKYLQNESSGTGWNTLQSDTNNNRSHWDISITSNSAKIKNVGNNTRYLAYNGDSKKFLNYTTSSISGSTEYAQIYQKLSCAKVTSGSANNMGKTTATLTWTKAEAANYTVAYWTGDDESTATVATTGYTLNGDTYSYVLTGLTPETTYHWYVIANCGDNAGGDAERFTGTDFTTMGNDPYVSAGQGEYIFEKPLHNLDVNQTISFTAGNLDDVAKFKAAFKLGENSKFAIDGIDEITKAASFTVTVKNKDLDEDDSFTSEDSLMISAVNVDNEETVLCRVSLKYIVTKETVATPVFHMKMGDCKPARKLTDITCETEGAVIYYTTDGVTQPTTSSPVWPASNPTPLLITSETTIKVLAVKSKMNSASKDTTVSLSERKILAEADFSGLTGSSQVSSMNNMTGWTFTSTYADYSDTTKGGLRIGSGNGSKLKTPTLPVEGENVSYTVVITAKRYSNDNAAYICVSDGSNQVYFPAQTGALGTTYAEYSYTFTFAGGTTKPTLTFTAKNSNQRACIQSILIYQDIDASPALTVPEKVEIPTVYPDVTKTADVTVKGSNIMETVAVALTKSNANINVSSFGFTDGAASYACSLFAKDIVKRVSYSRSEPGKDTAVITFTLNGTDYPVKIIGECIPRPVVDKPVVDPAEGTFYDSIHPTVTTTEGATVLYKTGSGEYAEYTDDTYIKTSTTVTFKATKEEWVSSEETAVTYTLVNNAVALTAPQKFDTSIDVLQGLERKLSVSAQYLRRAVDVSVKPAKDKEAAFTVSPATIAAMTPDAEVAVTEFTLSVSDVTNKGVYNDTLVFTHDGVVVAKTVLDLKILYPTVALPKDITLKGIYEGSTPVKVMCLYEDFEEDLEVKFTKNTNGAFKIVNADDHTTPVTSAVVTDEVAEFEVIYTARPDNPGKDTAWLYVGNKHEHSIMKFFAETNECEIYMENFKVEDSVIAAKITFDGASDKYDYRFAENAEIEETAAPNGSVTDEVVILTGLTANTLYRYQVRNYCTENIYSAWTPVQNFTTAYPTVTITSPENNYEFTEPAPFEFGFEVNNFTLSETVPAGENRLPYGSVTARFYPVVNNATGVVGEELTAYAKTGIVESPVKQWLPSLPANTFYKVVLTLETDDANALKEDAKSDGETFTVTMPKVAKPSISPNGGTFYNSVDVTLSDTSAAGNAKLFYSTDGKNFEDYPAAGLQLTQNTTLYVKAWKQYYDTSNVATAEFTVNTREDVANAAAVYGLEAGSTLSEKYYRITGELVITHVVKNSENVLRQRFFVQDKGITKDNGGRSLLIDPKSYEKLDLSALEAGQVIKNITGRIYKDNNMLVFEPVDEALTVVEGDPEPLHIDTLTIAEIKASAESMKRYQGALVCIKHVQFRVETGKGPNFVEDEFYTMDGRTGNIRFRTDFFKADYLTTPTAIPYGKELYVTGLMSQAADKIRITARSKADIADAPVVAAEPKTVDFGTLYTVEATDRTAERTVSVDFKNHTGKPVVTAKADNAANFSASLSEDGKTLTVSYTYNTATAGKHSAVYALDFVEASDTVRVSAESKLCTAPATFAKPDVTPYAATLQFTHGLNEFVFDTTSDVESGNLVWKTPEEGTSLNGKRIVLAELKPSTVYYYRVKTVCEAGNNAVVSAWSETQQFKTAREGAPSIQLSKPGSEVIEGQVEVVYDYRYFNLDAADTAVELTFTKAGTSETVHHAYDGTSEPYKVWLPSGDYTLTVKVVKKTGENTYIDAEDLESSETDKTITSFVNFSVNLPDVAAPVISAAAGYTAVAGNYYDSVEVVLNACADDATPDQTELFYSTDGENWTKYTTETVLKYKATTTVYAMAKKEHMDSTKVQKTFNVLNAPVEVSYDANGTVHTHSFNLVQLSTWSGKIDLTATYLRDDVSVTVKPQTGKEAFITVGPAVIIRNTNHEETPATLKTIPAEGMLKAGQYHDTIILSSQGVEISRVVVDFTVTGFKIPAVTATPENGSQHNGKVDVTLSCVNAAHPGYGYDIYYTLNGSVPDTTQKDVCFKYNGPFSIVNDTVADHIYTVKALAFDPAGNDTTVAERLTTVTYRVRNSVRMDGPTLGVYSLIRLGSLNEELSYTSKFVSGNITVTVKPGLGAASAVVTASVSEVAQAQAASFTVGLSTAALTPGLYSDTLVFTSAGKTLYKTPINLVVAAYRNPAVVITPNGGDVMDTNRVEVVMNPASTGKSAAGYEIRYTLDGSTPTLTNGVLYTAPADTLFKPANGTTLTVKALAFDKAGYDTAHADSLCTAVFEFKTTPVTPPAPDTVSSPRLTPNGGTFDDSVWVKMACDTAGATIKYRLGSTGAFAVFADSLKLTQSCTVEAFAGKAGLVNSDTVKVAFTINKTQPVTPPAPDTVSAPRLTPNGGSYVDSVWVKMACDTAGATIKYRLGSTDAFAVFADSVKVAQSCTVEAFAEKSGLINSDTVKVAFTITVTTVTPPAPVVKDTVAAPRITPNGGTFADSVEVTLACDTVGATIFYRTASNADFAAYNGKFKLYAGCTVEAYAAKDSLVNSAMVSAVFTITKTEPVEPVVPDTVKAPVLNPNGGSFEKEVTVTITCATSGAKIMYSLDGGEPDVVYTEPLKLTASCTLTAVAVKDSMVNSPVVSAAFTITGGTGVGSEDAKALKAGIYPNPTTGRFFVELNEDAFVEVFNGSGVRVLGEKMTSGKHEVNLLAQPAGIYFLKATSFAGKQSVTKRVVIR